VEIYSEWFLLVLTWIGLHLAPAGYRIVYDEVMKAIEANWPDQLPDNLPMVFPSWVDAPK
jgi:hypothetical protein